ncbi:hypothetical protein L0222_11820 [bacterium]|nr:hypothetical protein [bacterium]MCI0607322.1 hypothetical protein [bacterium]
MKKLAAFALITLFAAVMIAEATEVADVAKKERARREAIQKQGKTAKVFTNQDIANLKSTLAFEARTEPEGVKETTLPGIDTSAGDDVAQPKKKEPPQQQANEEIEKLREEREALEQQAKDAQQTINQGGGFFTRNLGNQYKQKREAESRIREIDQKLKEEEEKEKEDEQ